MRFLIFTLLLLAVDVSATTYYVANPTPVTRGPKTYEYVSGASNSNNGTSPSTPFATLDYACQRLSTGDTLLIMGGWWSENIYQTSGFDRAYRTTMWIRAGGTVNDPAAYKAFIGSGPGYNITQRPVLMGIRNDALTGYTDSCWNPIIMITNNSLNHIYIDSLVLDSGGTAGVTGRGNDYVHVINCNIGRIRNVSTTVGIDLNTGGILCFGTVTNNPPDTCRYWTIRHDTIHDIEMRASTDFDNTFPGIGNSDNTDGIHVYSVSGWTIDSNYIYNAYHGIRLKHHGDSCKIYDNVFEGMTAWAVVFGTGTVGASMHHNLVKGGGLLYLYQTNSYLDPDSVSRNWCYNNTAIRNQVIDYARYGSAAGIRIGVRNGTISSDNVQNNYIFNNVLRGFTLDQYNLSASINYLPKVDQVIFDYNCYFANSDGEVVAYIDSSTDKTQTLSQWRTHAAVEVGFPADQNTINVNPMLDENYALTDASPAALKTGGYGNVNPAFPTYMGAFDPNGSYGCTEPDPTTLVSPADASTYNVVVTQEDIVVLTWAADNSGQSVTYRVQIADDPSFNNITQQADVSDNFLAIGGYGNSHLEDGTGTVHYWRVYVLSGSCISQPSATRSFVLQDLAPPDWPIN